MEFTLQWAARQIGGRLVEADGDRLVRSVTTDTRLVAPGALFVALRGDRFDGHDFAAEAVDKGAVAVLSQRQASDYAQPLPLLVVPDTYQALLSLAGAYRGLLPVRIVGVTGSVGKTTTKDLIAAVLSQKMKTAKTQANLNNHIGVPRTLFDMTGQETAAVVEMGMNHFGEISALTQAVRPDIAVLTGIGVSHIENLGSRENILQAKLEILEGMAPEAPVILAADNDLLGALETLGNHRIIRTSALGAPAQVTAEQIRQDAAQSSFVLCRNGVAQAAVTLPAAGLHNVQNALLAAAVGFEFGLTGEEIARGLAAYEPSGQRQKLSRHGDVTFIEDCYNASPTSMLAALQVLSVQPKTRAIAVLGDMLELGSLSAQAHRDVGRAAAQCCDLVFCCGCMAEQIAQSAQENGCTSLYFKNREDCAAALINRLRPGDCVLFKASHSMQFEKIIQKAAAALEEKRSDLV